MFRFSTEVGVSRRIYSRCINIGGKTFAVEFERTFKMLQAPLKIAADNGANV